MALTDKNPVVIVGGGIIGLSIGWRLARRGAPVTIVDRGRLGRSASWVAAGMLAPHSEVGFEEQDVLQLGLASLRAYPSFLDELAADAGRAIALDRRGTLIVGFDRDDSERMRRLYRFRQQLDLPVEWLGGDDARGIEPLLSPKITSAVRVGDDSQVNNRAMVDALVAALDGFGVTLVENTEARSITTRGDRVTGVETAYERIEASAVVLAAGAWSGGVGGIAQGDRPPVRPVKGQIVSLVASEHAALGRVVRAPDVYILPKDDGRVIVGASQEEMGFDTTPTAGEVMRLLERAWEAVPSIYDLAIESIDVGLRPGSRDHQPIIGHGPAQGLYYATGHHRSGILLAPVTADSIASLILDGKESELLAPFAPTRFFASTRPRQKTR